MRALGKWSQAKIYSEAYYDGVFCENSQQLKAKILHRRCLKEFEISLCTTALKNNEIHPKKFVMESFLIK